MSEYPAVIPRVIEAYAPLKPSYGAIDVEAIFDEARGRYDLVQGIPRDRIVLGFQHATQRRHGAFAVE